MALTGPLVLSLMFAALFVTAIAPAYGESFMTPEFSRDEDRPKVLALLPPRAQVVEGKVASTEQLVSIGASLEDITTTIVADLIANKGYEIQRLTNEQVNADPELQNLVHRMNQRYDEERMKIRHKIYKVRDRRYSCGTVATVLANRLRVDGLLMVRVDAAKVSFGAALFANKRGYTRMDVSVIGADAGDVEAYFFSNVDVPGDRLQKNPTVIMEKVANKMVKKFPNNGQVIKVRKRYTQHTRKKKNEGTISDEQMLADLESMLGDGADKVGASQSDAPADGDTSADAAIDTTTVEPEAAPFSEETAVETTSGNSTK